MIRRIFAITLAAALAAAGTTSAQVIDRTKAPALGPTPKLALPALKEGTLANGLRWTLVEMHEVPLVQVGLEVVGGARDDDRIAGLATFTADMLDEGAGSRDALGIAAESEFLGAELRTFATRDRIGVSLNAPKRTLDEALALMADVALRPRFASAEVKRQRDLRLAAILQQRDQPAGMAALAFASVMYPADHPYRKPIGGDSASTVQLDSAMVRARWARAFVPARARVVITGDITPAEATALLEKHFGAWRAPAEVRGREKQPFTPRLPQTTIFLVDKPGAAQSIITIGQPGVFRAEPDWAATEVMNTILGGSFSSRLNTVLRETKGYTYGANSRYDYQPLPPAWTAAAAVRTDVTDSSLVEFMREIRRIRDVPVDADELQRARQYLILGLAGDFETTGQVADKIATAQLLGLPWNWYANYATAIGGVTSAQVQAAAKAHLDPARLTIVVVGDAAKVGPGLEKLGYGPVKRITLEGAPVAP